MPKGWFSYNRPGRPGRPSRFKSVFANDSDDRDRDYSSYLGSHMFVPVVPNVNSAVVNSVRQHVVDARMAAVKAELNSEVGTGRAMNTGLDLGRFDRHLGRLRVVLI